jgi:ATP synthase protein I
VPRPENPANGAHPTRVTVSEATASPWLRILARSAGAGAAIALVLAAAAALVTSPAAASSVLLGAALVVAFFGISLLIGHYTGRTNPSGALGLFAVTYAIKVVGFAAVLFLLGTPGWLERTWFFTGALATVIAWQLAEVLAFSRLRTPLYDDAVPPAGAASPIDPTEGR